MILGVHPRKQRDVPASGSTANLVELTANSNELTANSIQLSCGLYKEELNKVEDGSISVKQMKRNWEIACKLFKKDIEGNPNTNTNTNTNETTNTEVITVSMPSKNGNVDVPQFNTSLDNGSTLQVKHVNENWNKQNW